MINANDIILYNSFFLYGKKKGKREAEFKLALEWNFDLLSRKKKIKNINIKNGGIVVQHGDAQTCPAASVSVYAVNFFSGSGNFGLQASRSSRGIVGQKSQSSCAFCSMNCRDLCKLKEIKDLLFQQAHLFSIFLEVISLDFLYWLISVWE